jgi:DNA invertase Pin-like site-specific DNA recombinase
MDWEKSGQGAGRCRRGAGGYPDTCGSIEGLSRGVCDLDHIVIKCLCVTQRGHATATAPRMAARKRYSPSSLNMVRDLVIAPKLDRMFRSALDALQVVEALKTRGVKLHLIDLGGDIAGNGLSKLFLTIAAAFAEAERDRIRERVGQVKADQKARGRFLGGSRPFGFNVIERDDGVELVRDETEQAAIADMVAMRAQGLALRPIAEAMRAKGHAISHEGVARVLKGARS